MWLLRGDLDKRVETLVEKGELSLPQGEHGGQLNRAWVTPVAQRLGDVVHPLIPQTFFGTVENKTDVPLVLKIERYLHSHGEDG